jgi:hypothetical protein
VKLAMKKDMDIVELGFWLDTLGMATDYEADLRFSRSEKGH